MDLLNILIIVYVSIQCTIAVSVSLVALYTLSILLNNNMTDKDGSEYETVSKFAICKLWIKTSWKMRSIYSCVIIHIFDFTTDLLIIHEWFLAEDEKGDDIEHVDAHVMAWSSIGILIFYRIMSALGVLMTTDYGYKHALLQFLDVLLFVDVYQSHEKLVKMIINCLKVSPTHSNKPSNLDLVVIGMSVCLV